MRRAEKHKLIVGTTEKFLEVGISTAAPDTSGIVALTDRFSVLRITDDSPSPPAAESRLEAETQPPKRSYKLAQSELAARITGCGSQLEKHLQQLLNEVSLLQGTVDDAILIDVLDNTGAMLDKTITIKAYNDYANKMPGAPSGVQKILGAIMLRVSAVAATLLIMAMPAMLAAPTLATATAGVVEGLTAIASAYLGLGLLGNKGVARSMHQLATDRTREDKIPSEEPTRTLAHV